MIHKNWLELIKPQGLEVEPGADPDRVATAVAEPLERGFGLTLGNALRPRHLTPDHRRFHRSLGTLGKKPARKEAIDAVPTEQVVLETDQEA